MKWLIEIVDNEQTILDPFMGSGTTGVVAKQHRRNFIGIEFNQAYITIVEKRIAAVHVDSALPDFEKALPTLPEREAT